MTIRDILLDLVCTNEPLGVGTLMSRVLNHSKYEGGGGLYPKVQTELDKLCDEGLIYRTEVNMSKRFHA